MADVKNFSYSTIATAPSPATSGTSITVATGHGALFAIGRKATIYPTGVPPLASNAEIVTVTNIVGDVLTITRAQEGTSARTVVIGDQICQFLTAAGYNALEADVAGKEPALTAASQAEMEAGTEAGLRSMSPLRVKQAIEALAGPGGGPGDVVGPASAVDARVAAFDGTTGKLLKDGGKTVAELTPDAANVGATIHGVSAKTTPVDADTVPLIDSEASNVLKKLSWANIKATLKTYFDTIYDAAGAAAAITLTTLAGGTAPTGSGAVVRANSPTLTGTTTFGGTGGLTLDNGSASDGAISSSGGGQIDITAPIKLSGVVRDSANSLGTAGFALVTDGSGGLTYKKVKRSTPLHFVCWPGSTPNSIGSTETFFGGNNRTLKRFDSTGFTQVRITLHIGGTASNATTTIAARYFTSVSTTLGDYLPAGAGSTQVEVTLNTTINQQYTSGWIDLTSGAIGDVFWVLVCKDTANAALNPTVSSLSLEFR